jgi:hypothetical protein
MNYTPRLNTREQPPTHQCKHRMSENSTGLVAWPPETRVSMNLLMSSLSATSLSLLLWHVAYHGYQLHTALCHLSPS